MIAAAGLGVTVLILVVAQFVSAPQWVPAVSNVPIEQASALAERLAEAGITHRLARGGAEIMVAEPDLARARVALAKGGLSGGARPGLELFDGQTWGWNDFTQRVNYRRALEGELERTIGRMKGIERAEVHIAIAEQSAFRRSDPRTSTASVLIALARDKTPSDEVVRGIAQLVSSSVDGLSADQVSIHDETGRMWTEPMDGSPEAVTGRQFRMQEAMERYIADKAEAIVSDIVGPGNTRVRVSATVGFDRVERTTHTVDPAKQALASESKAEIIPGQQGGAGSTNVANSYENTRSVESFSGAVGTVRRLTVAVLINDRRLTPTPNDSTARYAPRTPDELARIATLVRNAVGIDSTRGDALSVVSQSFETPAVLTRAEPAPAPALADRVEQFQRPVLSALGIAAVLIIGFLTLRALRAPTMTMSPSTALAALPAAVPVALSRPATPADVSLAPGREKAVAAVAQHPDAAARMMKGWLKDG